MDKIKKARTNSQNKAIHKYLELLSDALNDAGFDVKQVIRVDIPWTPEMAKELIWRPVQKLHLGKESTTQLTTTQVDKIYEIINRAIGERVRIYVPFPSKEQINESNRSIQRGNE